MKLIAETAWHHEGDFEFMKSLVTKISNETEADIVKMHITLNLDEYMDKKHSAYNILKPWIFSKNQWTELIEIIRNAKKELMLLLNDQEAIRFGMSFSPEYVEIHSVCLNDIFMMNTLKNFLSSNTTLVLGVGGTDLYEIDNALNYMKHEDTVLMFGFQNYPTVYTDVNLKKIRRIMKLYPEYKYGYADHTAWDSPYNELITLLGGATGMSYIEKHVTTHYGEQRTDWSAAISFEMFNKLSEKIKILSALNGNGYLQMNTGEQKYSIFGPMKKTAVLNRDVKKGDILSKDMIKFIRTEEVSDLSQVDVINSFGKKITKDIKKNELLMQDSLKDKE